MGYAFMEACSEAVLYTSCEEKPIEGCFSSSFERTSAKRTALSSGTVQLLELLDL